VPGVNTDRSLANLSCYRWQKHCRGLYQTSITDFSNSRLTTSEEKIHKEKIHILSLTGQPPSKIALELHRHKSHRHRSRRPNICKLCRRAVDGLLFEPLVYIPNN
jgi:hypothetical protein